LLSFIYTIIGDEYVETNDEDFFDKFSVRAVLKDYFHSDPATRYQVAKNAFERALTDAKVISLICLIIYFSATYSRVKKMKTLSWMIHLVLK
jgi:hypothetical protein